jgi:hypothetical protein
VAFVAPHTAWRAPLISTRHLKLDNSECLEHGQDLIGHGLATEGFSQEADDDEHHRRARKQKVIKHDHEYGDEQEWRTGDEPAVDKFSLSRETEKLRIIEGALLASLLPFL